MYFLACQTNDSSSSSSSNEDKQQQTIVTIHEVTKRTKHKKSNHWYNNVVLTLEDIEFKKHFQITRSTFQYLCKELIPILQRSHNDNNNSSISNSNNNSNNSNSNVNNKSGAIGNKRLHQ